MTSERLSSSAPIVFLLVMLAATWPNLAGQCSKAEIEDYLREGIGAVRKSNLPEAERLLKLALERQGSPSAYYWLGVTYMKEHKPAESERALLTAISLQPSFPE